LRSAPLRLVPWLDLASQGVLLLSLVCFAVPSYRWVCRLLCVASWTRVRPVALELSVAVLLLRLLRFYFISFPFVLLVCCCLFMFRRLAFYPVLVSRSRGQSVSSSVVSCCSLPGLYAPVFVVLCLQSLFGLKSMTGFLSPPSSAFRHRIFLPQYVISGPTNVETRLPLLTRLPA